jgi:hypothetical protein
MKRAHDVASFPEGTLSISIPAMYFASAQSTTAVEKTAAITKRSLENLRDTSLVLLMV